MGHDGEDPKQVAREMGKIEQEEHEDHEGEKEHHVDSGEEETIKLEHDLQKLNALQYLLNEDSFEELHHEVSVIKEDPHISTTDKYVIPFLNYIFLSTSFSFPF